MKTSHYFIVICCALGILQSCQKESDLISTPGSKITQRTPGDPYIYDHRLTFDSWQDYEDYYDFLYDFNDDSGDIDSLLEIEEGRYDYTSLRSIVEKDELAANEIEEYYAKDFVCDIFFKSILNEYYEYGIADTVFVKFDKGRIYKIVGKDSDEVGIFRNIDKGEGIVPTWDYRENILMPYFNKFIEIGSTTDQPILPRTLFVRVNYDLTTGTCNSRARGLHLTAERSYDGSTWAPLTDGDWTINWGDGTGNFTFNDTEEVTTSHNYGSSLGNSFNLSISLSYWDNLTHSTLTYDDVIGITLTSACLNNEHYEDAFIVEDLDYPLNDVAMAIKFWRSENIREQFGALTHSWEWDQYKSKWVRIRRNLSVEFEASWMESNCSVEETINPSEDWNSRKKAQIVDRKGGDYNWWLGSEPVSEHWYKYHDLVTQTAIDNLVLDPCD